MIGVLRWKWLLSAVFRGKKFKWTHTLIALMKLHPGFRMKSRLSFDFQDSLLNSSPSTVLVTSIVYTASGSVNCRRTCNSFLLSFQVGYCSDRHSGVCFRSLLRFSVDLTRLFSLLKFWLRPFRLFSFCFRGACGAEFSPALTSYSTSRSGLSRPFGIQESYAVLVVASHEDCLL